jgi:hypothetical protein
VGKRLRENPIGAQLGESLREIREWRSFFRGSDIDPVRDLDSMVITAPELVARSDGLVAILTFNVDMARVRSAVDGLVSRHRGEWIAEAPLPAAIAEIQRGKRLFALVGDKKQLYVMPASERDKLAQLGKLASPSPDLPYAVKLSMVNPHRPLSRLPFAFPESITRLTLTATPTADGGLELAIVLANPSAEEATKNLPEIQKFYDGIQSVAALAALTGDGVNLPAIRFEVSERTPKTTGRKPTVQHLIEGRVTFPRDVLQRIKDLADKNLIHR